MDETPMWIEMPGKYTLHFCGDKEITASTTGHQKERLTIIIGAPADGAKLRPLELLPGVRPPSQEKFHLGYLCTCVVVRKAAGQMLI